MNLHQTCVLGCSWHFWVTSIGVAWNQGEKHGRIQQVPEAMDHDASKPGVRCQQGEDVWVFWWLLAKIQALVWKSNMPFWWSYSFKMFLRRSWGFMSFMMFPSLDKKWHQDLCDLCVLWKQPVSQAGPKFCLIYCWNSADKWIQLCHFRPPLNSNQTTQCTLAVMHWIFRNLWFGM